MVTLLLEGNYRIIMYEISIVICIYMLLEHRKIIMDYRMREKHSMNCPLNKINSKVASLNVTEYMNNDELKRQRLITLYLNNLIIINEATGKLPGSLKLKQKADFQEKTP